MAQVRCIFGSTGGNTELVVDKVADMLQEAGHEVTIQRVENSNIEDIKGNDLCILAASTYGHGIIQEHFEPFIKEMKEQDMNGSKYAVIGLGDMKYDMQYHIESAKILEETINEKGGELVQRVLRISGSPVQYLDSLIPAWTAELTKLI